MGSVAFYIGSLKKGGAERVFVNLATYFLEQGCNVTMVTQYKKENECSETSSKCIIKCNPVGSYFGGSALCFYDNGN